MNKQTILFLAANPLGTDRRALDEEARAIQEELERSGHRDRFELVTRWAVRPLDLLRELRKLKPTVVHFSGHGGGGKPRSGAGGAGPDVIARPAVDRGHAHGLFLQGRDGQPQLISTATLEETFGAAGASVKLVVLSACYSETHAEALAAHVGCVVGISGPIRDDAARIFAIGFYGGLGERESVATAYRQGVAAIRLAGLLGSERPQLEVRDGIDVEQLVLAADPAKTASASPVALAVGADGAAAMTTAADHTTPRRVAAGSQVIVVENNYGRIIVGDSYPKLIVRAAITGLVAGFVLLVGRYAAPIVVAWFGLVTAWLFKKRQPQAMRPTGDSLVARRLVGIGVAAAAVVGPAAVRTVLTDMTVPAPVTARPGTHNPVRADVAHRPNLTPQISGSGGVDEPPARTAGQDGPGSSVTAPPAAPEAKQAQTAAERMSTPVTGQAHVPCTQLIDLATFQTALGEKEPLAVRDVTKSDPDSSASCALLRGGEPLNAAEQQALLKKAGRLGVLPGDELCNITAYCAVIADADRFRAGCKERKDHDDDTLGSYACVHITAVGADDVKMYRFIHEDTRCILQVRGGPSNLDNDIIQSCAKAARDAIGPAQIRVDAAAATEPAGSASQTHERPAPSSIGAIATSTAASRTSSSPPDDLSPVSGPVATRIAELIRQLGDDDSRVRLSAAVNLTNLGDPRVSVILALTKALGNDTDESVRGAAAVGLSKLVTSKTDPKVRKVAVAALTQANQSDPSDLVRAKADNALKAIGVTAGGTQVQTPQAGSAIYVNIGPMASKTGNTAVDARLESLMVKVANQTMTRVASNMATTWPGGAPTQAMLAAKSTAGFYFDGTVNELKMKQAGSSTIVSCKINMLLASYPDKSIFELLNGGASVTASGSTNNLALAGEDCVSAVVEDLVAKKIVPKINGKAGR